MFCIKEVGCRENLVDIVYTLRSLPPQTLKQTYLEKSRLATQLTKEQVNNNLKRGLVSLPEKAEEKLAPPPQKTRVADLNKQSGKVLDFEVDPVSGNIVSLKEDSTGNRVITIKKDGEESEIATVIGRPGKYLITTVSGERREVESVKPTYKGFLAKNREQFYAYTLSNGGKDITLPVGFIPANFQANDVFKSGYMLFEKSKQADDNMVSSIESIGAIFGANKKHDYGMALS